MSQSDTCRHDAAAYALGALEPHEAEEFSRHLERCVVCRDELAAFEQAVNALPMAAPQYRPPPGLKRRVMRAVRAETKRRPAARSRRSELRFVVPRPALAAGLALTVAAAIAGVELSNTGTGGRLIQAQVGQAQLRMLGGRAELIVRHLPAPPPGRIYELWLQRASRPPSPSTLFSVTTRGTADVAIPGTLADLRRVMVTSEPAGGSSIPSEQPAIVVNS